MAATVGKAAFGYRFKRAGVDIAEVTAVGDVDLKLDMIEMTHDASPGGWKERIATLLDAGDIPVKLNFLAGDAGHIALRTDMTSRTPNTYSIVGPAAIFTWTLPGQISGYKLGELNPAGKLEVNVVLSVSGQPTFA